MHFLVQPTRGHEGFRSVPMCITNEADILLNLIVSGLYQLTLVLHLPNNTCFSVPLDTRAGYSTPILGLPEWPTSCYRDALNMCASWQFWAWRHHISSSQTRYFRQKKAHPNQAYLSALFFTYANRVNWRASHFIFTPWIMPSLRFEVAACSVTRCWQSVSVSETL
jgi:hypothetical protein